MSGKKPANGKGAAQAPKGVPVLRVKFGQDASATLPMAEVERQLTIQYVRMQASDSPELQETGRKLLADQSNRLAMEVARRLGSTKGGSNSPTPEWHAGCVEAAKGLLASGRKSHELSGILANRYSRDRKTIDAVLRKAGVK